MPVAEQPWTRYAEFGGAFRAYEIRPASVWNYAFVPYRSTQISITLFPWAKAK